MGCFQSKQQGNKGIPTYSSFRYRGPEYVRHDAALAEELLYSISSLGVDTAQFSGTNWQPSINRAGRQSSAGLGSGSHPLLGSQRAMSVKAVPGTQLQWTSSRKVLEEELQAANSHPHVPGYTDIDRLTQRLAHLRLDMWEMVGDGNCQFRSISNGLYGSEEHHALVRAMVVRHMRAHKADFEPYLGEDWGRYMADMAQDGTWGDELTLRACCDAYKIMISVITSDEAHWFVRYKPQGKLKSYKGSPREIFLTYIAPVHYNAIRRRTSQPNGGGSAVNTVANGPPGGALESLQESPPRISGSDTNSPFAAVQQRGEPLPPFS